MNPILFLLIILTICIVNSSCHSQSNRQLVAFDINKAAEDVKNLYESKKNAEAAQKANEVLTESRGIKKHDTDAMGIILFYRSRALADLGQYDESLNGLLEAKEFYRAHFPQDRDIRLYIDLGIGDCYFNLKQLDKAILIYKNIEMSDYMKEASMLHLQVYNCLSFIYLVNRDYQKAIEYYEKYLLSFELINPNAQSTQQYDEVNRKKESLKAALKAKSLNFSGEEYKDGFITYKVNNGGAGMMDIMYAKYLVSDLPDPSQKDLDEVFSRITKMEVITYVKGKKVKGMGHMMEEKTFKQLSQNQIKELSQCLKISEADITHVMNIGDVSFKIFDGDTQLGVIRYLENGYIRWENKWKDDALLINPTKFLEWLDRIGIDNPLHEWEKNVKVSAENERKLQTWRAAAPQTLIRYSDNLNAFVYYPTTNDGASQSENKEELSLGIDKHKLFDEIKEEIPDETQLILTLFKLYGNNFGSWSGFPLYEKLPAKVLLLINIEKLNQVIENQNLTAEHKEGIARFLSGWDFMQQRKSDIAKISQKTKDLLLKYLKEKGDKDKIKLFKLRVAL